MVKLAGKPERKLSNKQLDDALSNVHFSNAEHAKQFDHLSKQTWFRQYAKGSRAAQAKIVKKVRHGIIHDKYTDTNLSQLDEGWKRYYKPPKKSKAQKKLAKTQTKITKETETKIKKSNRKQREQIKKQERKAPSGRGYSSTEIHEGIKSKRAQAYRKKHGIPESDA